MGFNDPERYHYRNCTGTVVSAASNVAWSGLGSGTGALTPAPFRTQSSAVSPVQRLLIRNLGGASVYAEFKIGTMAAGQRDRVTIPAGTAYDTKDMLLGVTDIYFTGSGTGTDVAVEVMEIPQSWEGGP